MEKSLALPLRPVQARPQEQNKLTWADIGTFLRRYWGVILAVFVLTVSGAYATLSLLTEKYDTAASILVKMGRENLDPPPTVRNQNVFSSGLRREEVLSEIQFLQSRALVEAAVRDIGVEAFREVRKMPPDLLGRIKFHAKTVLRGIKQGYTESLYALGLVKRLNEEDGAVAEVFESLSVVHQKDTDVIALQLRMAGPELSRQVLDKIITHYMLNRIKLRQAGNVNAFLEEESGRLRDQLADSERRLAAWKLGNGLSATRDQKSALIQQINQLVADRDGTEREIRSVRQEVETSRKLLAALPETVRLSRQEVVNPSLQGLRQRLVTLQAERAKILTKFQPDSAIALANGAELDQIRKLIEAETATQTGSETIQANPVRQDLVKTLQAGEIRLAGLESRASVQARQIAGVQESLARLESADLQLNRIERQKQIDEGQYLEMLRRLQEAAVAEKLDLSRISNVTVLSPPMTTFQPVYPKKLLMMGVALGLGLVLGVGLSMLLAYMDDTVYQEEELETQLGLPCFGVVASLGPGAPVS